MLREITNDFAQQRGLRHAIAMSEPRPARITRSGDVALISFSDGRAVSMNKEPYVSETGFMAAVQQWALRHGANSLEVEYE